MTLQILPDKHYKDFIAIFKREQQKIFLNSYEDKATENKNWITSRIVYAFEKGKSTRNDH